MRLILMFSFLGIFSSCSGNLPFLNNDNPSSPSSEGDYIDLQVKLHSTYSLFKALNAGIITQEEYDELKKNILNL
tara:strand:- start:1880 stop:2104 length:225 start_codon:yes stop_codon:yes gene_type:complete